MQVKNLVLKASEPLVLVLIPVLLVATAVLGGEQTALLTIGIGVLALVPFLLRFEKRRPQARDIVPLVVLSVIASLGRVVFAAIPNFQPVSAIVIVSGLAFGPQAGFGTGALSAVTSNMFLGQGPWTPWQMFSWGLLGYLAGKLENTRLFRHKTAVYIFGFIGGFIFGWIMNVWFVIGFVSPITKETVLAAYAASLSFDFSHAMSNVLFLVAILVPWRKKLDRIKLKFGIIDDNMALGTEDGRCAALCNEREEVILCVPPASIPEESIPDCAGYQLDGEGDGTCRAEKEGHQRSGQDVDSQVLLQTSQTDGQG